jgi:hypothetical protein
MVIRAVGIGPEAQHVDRLGAKERHARDDGLSGLAAGSAPVEVLA